MSTVPSEKNLHAFLVTHGLVAHQAEVQRLVRLVVSDFYDFIQAHSGKAKWTAEFSDRFFAFISARSPWITRETFSGLSGYGHWLCWHEGFDL